MSKININSNIGEFFRKNKVRIGAIALSTVMLGSLVACKPNTKTTVESTFTTISQQQEDILAKQKANIQKNIRHMEVIKDDYNGDGAYQVIQALYKETPIYEYNENGEKYVARYHEEFKHIYQEFTVSYIDAEKMGVVELLESQVVGYTKSK